MAAILFK